MQEVVDVPVDYMMRVVRGNAQDTEPIDLAHVTQWGGHSERCFRCKVCNDYCDIGYEVHFQWGDTERHTYVDEMCGHCLSTVCKASRNAKASKYVLQ
jgi:MinD superfamily P-loop ATPase